MIQNKLLSANEVLVLSLTCFTLGSAIGLYLAMKVGLLILLLGLIGILGGFLYTAPPVFLVSRGVGELVIAVNFGVLPVVGAYFVQTGQFRWDVVLLSLPVAFLIAAILFINQFQDYEADKATGKRNWVVRLGRHRSVKVFLALMIAWALPLVIAVALRIVPTLGLISLIPLASAILAVTIAARRHEQPQAMTPANALTVITHLAVGLLLSTALLVAGCGKSEKPSDNARPVNFSNISKIRISATLTEKSAGYLGLSTKTKTFAPTDIKSSTVIIQLFDMYCMLCQSQAPEVNRLYEMVQQSNLKDKVRFVGIGKKNTRTEANIYGDQYDVPFPLFGDPDNTNVPLLGVERTPNFIILDLINKKVTHHQWEISSAEQLFDKLKLAVGGGSKE